MTQKTTTTTKLVTQISLGRGIKQQSWRKMEWITHCLQRLLFTWWSSELFVTNVAVHSGHTFSGCVCAPVGQQWVQIYEGSATHAADIRPLVRVRAFVFGQGLPTGKGARAQTAFVRTLAHVSAYVVQQCRLPHVASSAHVAFVRWDTSVNAPVSGHASLGIRHERAKLAGVICLPLEQDGLKKTSSLHVQFCAPFSPDAYKWNCGLRAYMTAGVLKVACTQAHGSSFQGCPFAISTTLFKGTHFRSFTGQWVIVKWTVPQVFGRRNVLGPLGARFKSNGVLT